MFNKHHLGILHLVCAVACTLATTSIPLDGMSQWDQSDSLIANQAYQKAYDLLSNHLLDSSLYYIHQAKNSYEQLHPGPHATKFNCYRLLVAHYRMSGDYALGLQAANAGLDQAESLKDTSLLASAYRGLGNIWFNMGAYPSSDSAFDIALNLLHLLGDPANETLSTLYNDKGLLHHKLFNTDSAIYFFEKKLVVDRILYKDEPGELGFGYGNLAIAYQDLGDYSRAIKYLHTSESLFKEKFGPTHQILATTYYNLALNYSQSGQPDTAIAYLWRAKNIRELTYPKDHRFIAEYWEGIGKNYADKGDFDLALKYYQTARAIFVTKDPSTYDAASFQAKVGYVYLKLKRWQEAHKQFDQALQIRLDRFGAHDAKVMDYRIMLGVVESSQQKFEAGLAWYGQAVAPFNFDFDQNDFSEIPRLSYLLRILTYRSKTYLDWYLADLQTMHLDSALHYSGLSLKLLDYVRQTHRDDEARILLNENAKETLQLALRVIAKKYEITTNETFLNQFFDVLERYKASSLLAGLTEKNRSILLDLPPELLAEERAIMKELTKLEMDYRQLLVAGQTDSAQLVQLQIFDQKRKLDGFAGRIEESSPKYFNLLYQPTYATLKEVQNSLGEGELLVNYFVDQDVIFIFYADHEQTNLVAHPSPQSLEKLVTTLRDTFFDPGMQLQNNSDFDHISVLQQLSEQLLEPLPLAEKEYHEICFIPDGVLNVLPFDCLFDPGEPLDLTAAFSELPYLCKKYDLYFLSSASTYLQHKEKDHKAVHLLAFAPSYRVSQADIQDDDPFSLVVRSGHLPLPNAQLEAEEVSRLWHGEVWSGAAASKAAFLQHVHEGDIIHLSMHAIVDHHKPLQSKLVFASDSQTGLDYLHAAELYQMSLDASMVVLSACNTGYGKIAAGEGTHSLARAFSFAGIPSTVMSLWKIPDASSSQLMVSFYEFLREGKSKASAIGSAKRKYLEQVADPKLAHPFYWAGLVVAGNPSPLAINNNSNVKLIGIGLFSLLLILLYFWKKIR